MRVFLALVAFLVASVVVVVLDNIEDFKTEVMGTLNW